MLLCAPGHYQPAGQLGDARCTMISTTVAAHIAAFPMLTTTARPKRCPFCSYGQAAIVRFAPSQVHHVHNECWLESPLAWTAHIVGM